MLRKVLVEFWSEEIRLNKFLYSLTARELLWCSGVLLFVLMMATAFTGALVRRAGRFSTLLVVWF